MFVAGTTVEGVEESVAANDTGMLLNVLPAGQLTQTSP